MSANANKGAEREQPLLRRGSKEDAVTEAEKQLPSSAAQGEGGAGEGVDVDAVVQSRPLIIATVVLAVLVGVMFALVGYQRYVLFGLGRLSVETGEANKGLYARLQDIREENMLLQVDRDALTRKLAYIADFLANNSAMIEERLSKGDNPDYAQVDAFLEKGTDEERSSIVEMLVGYTTKNCCRTLPELRYRLAAGIYFTSLSSYGKEPWNTGPALALLPEAKSNATAAVTAARIGNDSRTLILSIKRYFF